MVSPGNTFVCLTEPSPTLCKPNEPDVYYPSGTRNYVRVVPNDAVQRAGLATFANEQGIRNPTSCRRRRPDEQGPGRHLQGAARKLGMNIAGFEQWNPKATSYTGLMSKVKASAPTRVLLAGLLEQNGAQLIKDKVVVLGPNDGAVKLLAPDGFAQQATIDQAGAASKGMFVSQPGKVPGSLTGRARPSSRRSRRRPRGSRSRSSLPMPARPQRC